MGRLHWRERWSALGCRRGWWRLAAFVLFVTLTGYFGFYAVLRVTGEIQFSGFNFRNMDGPLSQFVWAWNDMRMGSSSAYAVYRDDPRIWETARKIEWPRNPKALILTVMWPAVMLEAALDRRGWLPWTNIFVFPPRPLPIPESPSPNED